MNIILKKILVASITFSALVGIEVATNLANASPITGHYAPVGRSNDPFVFCTQGVKGHNWAPVNPLAGTWRCTRRCKYVNKYWIPTYQSICPAAMSRGAWKGPGSGDQYKAVTPGKLVPFAH